MIKTSMPHSKLFLVCPFCQMETFIRKEYGNVYFLTAPASIFNFSDEQFAKEISTFLTTYHITDVYVVCDLTCKFIHNALAAGPAHGLSCEQTLECMVSRSDDPFSLAQKIIQLQVTNIKNAHSIHAAVNERKIKIHGIVTSKLNNRFIPVSYVNGLQYYLC